MAARFWVGGSGTWDNASTANWAATSGGAPGASAPTTADTVTFDANSGTAATVTVAATATASACTINKADANLNLSGSPTVTGALTLTAGVITLNSNTFTCGSFVSSNSNTRTIAFGTGSINVIGNNGSVWACSTITNLTVSGSRTVNLTYSGSVGTRALATGASEAVAFDFNVSSGTDIVTFSGGFRDLNFTGFSGTLGASSFTRTVYGSLTFSVGMTLSTDTGVTVFAATSGTKTITTNGKTVNAPLTFNGVGGTFVFADALTMGPQTFTVGNGTVRLKAGTTNTVGSFATGGGTTQRFLQSDAPGTQATISGASGANTTTYLTLQDVAATGGATWTALQSSNNVDAGGNSGWNFGDYASSGLSRGAGLYAGAKGLWGGNSGLWGGFSGLQN